MNEILRDVLKRALSIGLDYTEQMIRNRLLNNSHCDYVECDAEQARNDTRFHHGIELIYFDKGVR